MIRVLNTSFPIIEKDGFPSEAMNEWLLAVSLNIPMTGIGSPEGVVNARLYQVYLDTTGGAGAIEYRKMLPDVGGDKTQGWIQV